MTPNKLKSLVKRCIAEVITEVNHTMDDSGQSNIAVGSPGSLERVKIEHRKTIEVLHERLSEGFDPWSNAGPNPEATNGESAINPYRAWNSKMRRMEDNDVVPNINCPFCGFEDLDLPGLKSHLVNGDCEKYNEIEDLPRI